jgi:magnesium-transporting ATPase (P-type)
VFFLLFNNFIPISLYVTVELVNLGQAYLVAADEEIVSDL